MSVSRGEHEIFCPTCLPCWQEALFSSHDFRIDAEEDEFELISAVAYRSGVTDGVPERLIYHLKHRDERRVFDYVAQKLWEMLRFQVKGQSLLITYPPRRAKAIRKDGFDQGMRLAQALSRVSGIPVLKLLIRTNSSAKEQKRLGAADREINASKAYAPAYEGMDLSQKQVIIVDDLYTTGATLRACARLIQSAGAERVFLVTVGRTKQKE